MEAFAPTNKMQIPVGNDNPKPSDLQLGYLRDLRVEVQDLHSVLERIRKGDTDVKSNAKYIHKTRKDVDNLMDKIHDGDTVRHLQNEYEQMIQNPLFAAPEKKADPKEQLHDLNLLVEQIRKIEFYVGYLTIADTVNKWLIEARPGYYLPFHIIFEDEVPNADDRTKILSFLAWAPNIIKGGIVDVANGLIYRYSRSSKIRSRHIWYMAGVFLVLTGVIVGACYLPFPDWPIHAQNLPSLLAGWGAILIGVVVHIAVGMVKRSQSQGNLPPIAPLSDLQLILDARSGQIIMKLFLALIGFFGLVFASGLDNVTPFNAFLVGYSLDSFVEIFGTSVEQRATTETESLKKQLGVTGD